MRLPANVRGEELDQHHRQHGSLKIKSGTGGGDAPSHQEYTPEHDSIVKYDTGLDGSNTDGATFLRLLHTKAVAVQKFYDIRRQRRQKKRDPECTRTAASADFR